MNNAKSAGLWKRTRTRIALVAVAGAVALAVIPAVASAWFSWSGVDPIIDLNDGRRINITVRWLPENHCAVGPVIPVRVKLDRKLQPEFVAESTMNFNCPDGTHTVRTETMVLEVGHGFADKAEVTAAVESAQSFGVLVEVKVSNSASSQTTTLSGTSVTAGAAPGVKGWVSL